MGEGLSAENDAPVPTVGSGLMDEEAAYLYGVFADLSEATIDPWVCADLANFTVGYIRGKYVLPPEASADE